MIGSPSVVMVESSVAVSAVSDGSSGAACTGSPVPPGPLSPTTLTIGGRPASLGSESNPPPTATPAATIAVTTPAAMMPVAAGLLTAALRIVFLMTRTLLVMTPVLNPAAAMYLAAGTPMSSGIDHAQVRVRVLQFEQQRLARFARAQVLVDLAPLRAWTSHRGRTQRGSPRTPCSRRRAASADATADRPSQTFSCPVGERSDSVGCDAEQRRDLGGAPALDLGVPQHQLPPFWQAGECRRDQRLVVLARHGIEQ